MDGDHHWMSCSPRTLTIGWSKSWSAARWHNLLGMWCPKEWRRAIKMPGHVRWKKWNELKWWTFRLGWDVFTWKDGFPGRGKCCPKRSEFNCVGCNCGISRVCPKCSLSILDSLRLTVDSCLDRCADAAKFLLIFEWCPWAVEFRVWAWIQGNSQVTQVGWISHDHCDPILTEVGHASSSSH